MSTKMSIKISKPKIGERLKALGIRPPSRKGIRHTAESIQLMREVAKGRANYKGGLTRSNLYWQIRKTFEYRQWRSDVFTRDDFTCQECKIRGGDLHAHHKKEFARILDEYSIKTIEQALSCPELWNINNGETLHKVCHKNRHRRREVGVVKGVK